MHQKNDYQRLLMLNNHIDELFKERIKKVRKQKKNIRNIRC